jgi:CSLREA domain-containing protein
VNPLKVLNNSILTLGLVLFLSGPSFALDFIVNSTADVADANPGDGVCNPVNALPQTCTLRAAIMEANALGGAHNILLPSGVYVLNNLGEDEDQAGTGDLDIHAEILIVNGTNNRPLISGNATDRIFDIHAGGELTLDNVDLTGGRANSPATIRGAAVNVRGDARLLLQRSRVSLNLANQGGAIYSDGFVHIVDSELFHNAIVAEVLLPEFSDGAAVFNRGVLIVERSTLRDNGRLPGFEGPLSTAEYAIHSRRGFVTGPAVLIGNATVFNNTNGVFSDGVPTLITHSTIVNNNQRGLRFLRDLDALGDVQLTVVQSVLYGHASDCNDLISAEDEFDLAFNINASSDESCGFTGFNDLQNISNPFFGGLADHGGATWTLMPRSNGPLIDPVGGSCGTLTEDQRGGVRPIDGNGIGGAICDIGAVEFDPDSDPEFTDRMFSDRFEQG